MSKICPNCKSENEDSAEFCQECGTKLPKYSYSVPPAGEEKTEPKKGNWWSKQTNTVKVLTIVGGCCVGLIVIIGLLAVLFPDATTFNYYVGDTTALTKTFSQNGLTFNYPDDWQTATSQGDIVSSGSSVQYLTSLYGSDGLTLHVSMGDLAAVGATMAQAKEATKTNIQGGSSAKLLSDTQTTVNGLTMYKMVFTLTDPTYNQENKVLTAITGKEGQKVYYMQFIAETSVFDNNQKLMDNILNSVKVS